MNVQRVIVHCSAGDLAATMEDVRRFHTERRGWSDIGYHYVVESSGRLRVGRRADRAGAHVQGLNADSLGVCMVGHFDRGRDVVSPDQWTTTTRVCADLLIAYGLKVDALIGHREAYAVLGEPQRKSCPGTGVDLDALRHDVAGLMDAA